MTIDRKHGDEPPGQPEHERRAGNRRKHETDPGHRLVGNEMSEVRGGNRVMDAKLRRHLREWERGDGDDERRHHQDGPEPTPGAPGTDPPGEPDCEDRERCGGVPLTHVVEVAGGEEADLRDEQEDVCGTGRRERARCTRERFPASGGHDEQRRRDGGYRHAGHHQSPEVPDEREREPACSLARVSESGIAPEDLGRPQHAGRNQLQQDDHDRQRADRGCKRHQWTDGPGRGAEAWVEPDRQGACREQDERLHADGRSGSGSTEEHALPEQRWALESEREGKRGPDRRGIEQRLRHEQAAIEDGGRREGDRGRRHGPPGRGYPPCPEVRRYRRRRDGGRLKELCELDTPSPTAELETGTDKCGCQEAVVRGLHPANRQRPVFPQGLAEEPIEHLVGRDPGDGELTRDREADHRGGDDEYGDGRPGSGTEWHHGMFCHDREDSVRDGRRALQCVV